MKYILFFLMLTFSSILAAQSLGEKLVSPASSSNSSLTAHLTAEQDTECRGKIEKAESELRNLKEIGEKSIQKEAQVLREMFEKATVTPAVKKAVQEYKETRPYNEKFPRLFSLEYLKKVGRTIGVKVEEFSKLEVNCQKGPDFLWSFQEGIGECVSGFSRERKTPFITVISDVIETKATPVKAGDVLYTVCRQIHDVPVYYTICGEKNLETGEVSIGTSDARRNVQHVFKSINPSKVYKYTKGNFFNLDQDLKSMVKKELILSKDDCADLVGSEIAATSPAANKSSRGTQKNSIVPITPSKVKSSAGSSKQ